MATEDATFTYDGVEYYEHYAQYCQEKEAQEFLSAIARSAVLGDFQATVDDFNKIRETVPEGQLTRVQLSPVYHFLFYLILTGEGKSELAANALQSCRSQGGAPELCKNDMAVILARGGTLDLARRCLDAWRAEFPGDLRLTVNAFALANAEDPESRAIEDVGGLGDCARAVASAMVQSMGNSLDENKPEFVLFKTMMANGLRRLRRADWEAGSLNDDEKVLACSIADMIRTLDRMPPIIRDYHLYLILRVSPADASILRRCLKGWGEQEMGDSPSISILAACLSHALHKPEAEEEFKRLSKDKDGFLARLGLAFIHGEAGRVEKEYACINAILSTHGDDIRFLFHAANNRFRAGDCETANQLARKAVERTADDSKAFYYAPARRNAGYLEKAIKDGLRERDDDVDPYGDPHWVKDVWDHYMYEFTHFTCRQNFSNFFNQIYLDTVAATLAENPDIRCVLNFGSFCGYYDHLLAQRHPDIHVIGFGRNETAINLNKDTFVADNLEFDAGSLDQILARATAIGPTVVVHIRTCTLLYPVGVEDVYRACHAAGVEVIVGIEGTGYSFQIDAFPELDDPDREPVMMQGIMVDHNYPRILDAAGYQMVEQTPLLFPIISPIQTFKEQGLPLRFIARRRQTHVLEHFPARLNHSDGAIL